MANVSKVGRRGQITLPSSVRKLLEVEEGDHVAFVRLGGSVVLQRMPHSLRDLRGSVPAAGEQDFDSVRAAVRSKRGRRARSARPCLTEHSSTPTSSCATSQTTSPTNPTLDQPGN